MKLGRIKLGLTTTPTLTSPSPTKSNHHPKRLRNSKLSLFEQLFDVSTDTIPRHSLVAASSLLFLVFLLLLPTFPSFSRASTSPSVSRLTTATNSTPAISQALIGESKNASMVPTFRAKRQFEGGAAPAMCPTGCFPCSPMLCQSYQTQCMPQATPPPRVVNMMSCCCIPLIPAKPDLKTACDGEEAVAGCLNGLCGQGYECTKRRYCCRCKSGKSLGACVNGLCPSGYSCEANDYCCPSIATGPSIGPCVRGLCPNGYECGPDDLCHAKDDGVGAIGKSSLVGEFAARELIRELFTYIKKHRDLDESLRHDSYVRRTAGLRGFGNKKRLLGGKTKKRRRYSLLTSSNADNDENNMNNNSWEVAQMFDDDDVDASLSQQVGGGGVAGGMLFEPQMDDSLSAAGFQAFTAPTPAYRAMSNESTIQMVLNQTRN